MQLSVAAALAVVLVSAFSADVQAEPTSSAALSLEESFSRAADRILPSIVAINTYARGKARRRPSETGWRVAGQKRNPHHRLLLSRTGFVVSDEGFILTSHHGVLDPDTRKPAEIIEVELADRSFAHARFIGAEPNLDLAVIKLDLDRPVSAAPIARDATLRTGSWAIAVGDPPGPERTFAAQPIASPPQRECYQEELTATLIQASMHVPPESWGGPWVNLRGDVIGIGLPRRQDLLAGSAPSGAAFALPIDLAMNLYEPLIVRESAKSPWLGISVLEAPRAWRTTQREARLTDRGVLIDDIFDPSPAASAGLRVGDVLTRLGNEPVTSVASFQRQLYLNGIDAPVTLEFWRNGERSTAKAIIRQRPDRATVR